MKIIIAFCIAAVVSIHSNVEAAIEAVTPEVEKAVLAEDWSKTVELLSSVDAKTPSPTLRLLKGLTCQALNRSNEALSLFLASTSTEDVATWKTWAEDFQRRHPSSAVGRYFQGDALARS